MSAKDGQTKRVEAEHGYALAQRARKFREREQTYYQYVEATSAALAEMMSSRTAELKVSGRGTDAHDNLLEQLRGLRARFTEVDAITRSLLLNVEENGEKAIVWEEVLASMNALQALEMEARAAQTRAAQAAVFRDYMGENGDQTRRFSVDVNLHLARRFNSLVAEVRDIQASVFGRRDSFSPGNLLERLIALGAANPRLVAQMGVPQTRAALVAVSIDYMAESVDQTRKISLEVSSHLSRRFSNLVAEVREIQVRVFGLQEPFTPANLLERLIALGAANPELVAQMGAPQIAATAKEAR